MLEDVGGKEEGKVERDDEVLNVKRWQMVDKKRRQIKCISAKKKRR